MKISITDEAAAELDDAFNYYQHLQLGLGNKFISRFKEASELIQIFPRGWQQLSTQLRRTLIKGFPYGIIYYLIADEIIVVAIANLNQKPKSLERRII